MRLFILFTVLFMHGFGAHGSDNAIGRMFYIPNHDLLGENLVGGQPLYKNLSASCLGHKAINILDSIQSYFENTESFYSSLSTTTSIAADLKSDFTMGMTLDTTTDSISGGNRTVKGMTYSAYSETTQDYIEASCTQEAELSDQVVQAFERLVPTINSPWLDSNWAGYKNFLQTFGSHVVTQVIYGSSVYQHSFSESSQSYTRKDFAIKACVGLTGPTQAGLMNVSVCTGVTQQDVDSVEDMAISSRFVARGGSDDTRAQLYNNRSDELIQQFLSEAKATHEPIQYKFTPIWVILHSRYIGTEHFAKVINLEAYYKGYLNYQCNYQKSSSNIVLQMFNHTEESTPDYPVYQCIIPPVGCQDDDDCHYRSAWWCECRGDSCVRYSTSELNTGVQRTSAYIFEGRGWGWQGCGLHGAGLSCRCKYRNYNWKTVWSPSMDSTLSTYLVHSDELTRAAKNKRSRDEL